MSIKSCPECGKGVLVEGIDINKDKSQTIYGICDVCGFKKILEVVSAGREK